MAARGRIGRGRIREGGKQRPAIGTEDAELAELCKALAHPARVKIVRHLIEQSECLTGELVDVLPLAQSTVSQHLKVLRECGVVTGEIDGPRRCYCVAPGVIERLSALLGTLGTGTRCC
jgi:ArsR family transcriptional regulator